MAPGAGVQMRQALKVPFFDLLEPVYLAPQWRLGWKDAKIPVRVASPKSLLTDISSANFVGWACSTLSLRHT